MYEFLLHTYSHTWNFFFLIIIIIFLRLKYIMGKNLMFNFYFSIEAYYINENMTPVLWNN